MINLITSFFIPKEVERQEELLKCLKYNVSCPYLKKIYLFIEKTEDIDFLKKNIQKNNKINIILWNKQPTYADYLKLANQLQGEICMISNADIWLKTCDEELIYLLKQHPNISYSLTRHEYDMSSPLIKRGKLRGTQYQSYDSFLFKSPINIDYKLIDHVQNRMGAENVFKIELEKIGITFINPCKVIIIVHEHKSNIRTYDDSKDMINNDYRRMFKYTPIVNKEEILNHFRKKSQSQFQRKSFSTVSQMFSR